MRRRRRRRKHSGGPVLITPVLDVMFLLIIALLALGHLRPKTADRHVATAPVDEGETPDPSLEKLESLRGRLTVELEELNQRAGLHSTSSLEAVVEETRRLPGQIDVVKRRAADVRERLEELDDEAAGDSEARLTGRLDRLERDQEELRSRARELLEGSRQGSAPADEAIAGELRKAREQAERTLAQGDRELSESRQRLEERKRGLRDLEEKARQAARNEEALSAADAEIARLEEEKRNRLRELDRLEAMSSDSGGKQKLAGIPPAIDPDREASALFPLMIARDRVFPLEEPYCTFRKFQGGVLVEPAKGHRGLAAQQAIASGSALRKKIGDEEFRRSGRVALLVTQDGFAAYRTVRDYLVAQGIDYGVMLLDGPSVGLSDGEGGEQIHGRKRR